MFLAFVIVARYHCLPVPQRRKERRAACLTIDEAVSALIATAPIVHACTFNVSDIVNTLLILMPARAHA